MANGLLACAYGRSAAEGFDAATDYRASMPQFTSEAYEKNDALFEFLHRIAAIDDALDQIPTSEVFGGTRVEG